MTTIIGISGSLRRESFNRKLLVAARDMAPDGVTIEVRGIHEIPLYDGDREQAEGSPDAVARLKDEIADADGLLLVTPEYNHSIPGVFKNAIDWMSRPPADQPRVFGGKPTGLIGATPGRMGTVQAQQAWLPVLKTLGTQLYTGGSLLVSGAGKVFDDDGKLTDDLIKKLLREYLEGFCRFVQSRA